MPSSEHLLGKVDGTVAGSLRANEGPAKTQPLAGEDAVGTIGKLFHHACHEAHFPGSHADIPRWYIDIRAYMPEQLRHIGLAEAHDLARAAVPGVEIGATLAATHGKCSKRVLESLLEREELEDGKIDRGMKAGAPLIGANGGTVLYAVAAVDFHLTPIIHPGHTKNDYSLRLYKAVENAMLRITRVFGNKRPEALHDFRYCLKIFGLPWTVLRHVCAELLETAIFHWLFPLC
jgi:hypothetical protein